MLIFSVLSGIDSWICFHSGMAVHYREGGFLEFIVIADRIWNTMSRDQLGCLLTPGKLCKWVGNVRSYLQYFRAYCWGRYTSQGNTLPLLPINTAFTCVVCLLWNESKSIQYLVILLCLPVTACSSFKWRKTCIYILKVACLMHLML